MTKTFNVIYSETIVYEKRYTAKNKEEAEKKAKKEISSDDFNLKTWSVKDVFETNIDDVSEVE